MNFPNLFFLLLIYVAAYLPYKGKVTTDISSGKTLFLSISFLVWAGVLYIFTPHSIFSYRPVVLFLFGTTIFCWFYAPFFIPRLGVKPTAYIQRNQKRYLVQFDIKTYFIKFCEVLFQQAGFLYALFAVFTASDQTTKLIWFTIFIALIHTGNFLFMDEKSAFVFTILSIPGAIVFGFLILNGYILLATSIHLVFYLLMSTYHWLPKKII